MSYDDTRNDVKVLVEKIETLATQVKDKLDNGGDYLTLANELVRNSSTFVFALGEMCALEQLGKKSRKVKVVKNPSATPRTYKRDSLGRFSS